ncbi:hypothetical protein EDL98_05805 [Ornithobacterium rhinotracheale]|uniref:hypothetical protein n=1 Tax=Ornithobacterium rhinotracheale TaxID=28251 RepID=UPI00129C2034|nr:hypothetical protein [Ornithobacterium rhinotracheale]MRJ08098.1 hypothetical protein [Ornithobacterium rhinotracheale]MRJ10597.1 hypothetical protein [Ornithobacterium rhinotracheale]UOH78395.1 hypothetical protein MT996_02745 [Ornithobacterium rhinotracheale]
MTKQTLEIGKFLLETLSNEDFQKKVKEGCALVDEKAQELKEQAMKSLDKVEKHIDTATAWIVKNTDKMCTGYSGIEILELDFLKSMIDKNKTNDSVYAAILNFGRNKKDELLIFLQLLDENKKYVENTEVAAFECQALSKNLRDLFNSKSLVLINLKK